VDPIAGLGHMVFIRCLWKIKQMALLLLNLQEIYQKILILVEFIHDVAERYSFYS
jgi:hypothetical protein